MNTRRQLTLFLPSGYQIIEMIRERFNPIQQQLIAAHITLCREDEIESLDRVLVNLKSIRLPNPIRIDLDSLERSDHGKGLLLASHSENIAFHSLRKLVLAHLDAPIHILRPHITLLHPRNSTCTDEIFNYVSSLELPTEISFDCVSLIEQKDGGRWKTIESFQIFTPASE